MNKLLFLFLGALIAGCALAWAQQALDPKPVAAACAYSTSPPTVATGNFVYVQCNSLGQLLVH